jgi:hypothetical protein
MSDPRIVSAIALMVIGLALTSFVIRVWLTHPVNRVFLVGQLVTEEGLRFMLKNLPTVFALGLFSITAALAKLAYAMRWQGNESAESYADILGTIEAIFAVWAAGCVLLATVRLCRKG